MPTYFGSSSMFIIILLPSISGLLFVLYCVVCFVLSLRQPSHLLPSEYMSVNAVFLFFSLAIFLAWLLSCFITDSGLAACADALVISSTCTYVARKWQ